MNVPEKKITYTVDKKGKADLASNTITWMVDIDAKQDGTPIDLAGYQLVDDLTDVGEYVANSFEVEGIADTAPTATEPELRYEFPVGATSPQKITFQTAISDKVLTAGGEITNGASLNLGEKQVASDADTVEISKPTVTKTGKAGNEYVLDEEGKSTGVYNSKDRTITWYIEVDNKGRTLKNLVITDVLKDDLEFVSAKWQKWNENDNTWVDVDAVNRETKLGEDKYNIGNTVGDVDYKGRLELVTKVPDGTDGTDGTVIATTYRNTASAVWGEGDARGSASSEDAGVGIGYNAIQKRGKQVGDDVANHQITWTIEVDMKGQSAEGFKVYDLLVYGKESDKSLEGVAGIPEGVTPHYGQKYVKNSLSVDLETTTVKVTTIMNGDGKPVADLLEITNLSKNKTEINFKSQVLDPTILAGNNSNQKVYNTAALYKNTTFRGQAKAEVPFNNKVLSKELLHRDEVGRDHTTGTSSINANHRAATVADGFHYGHKEVIFRLNVNAAGLNFANTETNLPEGYGDVVVKDTLPEGWEFAPFVNEKNYLIFDGTVTAKDTALASVDGLTAVIDKNEEGKATFTFTFTELTQPYVILIKAKPTDETFEGYLKDANTRNETNTLGLYSANWTPGVSTTQNVQVDSTVLAKTLDLSKQTEGVLTWHVKYTPFGHEIGTGLEDTLPEGIDLRTDSSGQLVWEQDGVRNINVHELTLQADGTYKPGSELAPDVLKSAISYENDTRKLTFKFPDKEKAYELSYVTDITGMPGTVTNAVKLVDATGTGTGTGANFMIAAMQGEATMKRSGYLVLKKADMNGGSLAGAEFTLYNTNTDGSKGSARAVRTTGSDGIIKFYGLAPGNYILVETKTPDDAVYGNPNLQYNVLVASDRKTTVNGSDTITVAKPFNVVNYKKTDAVGSLTISKTVAGNGADHSKAFTFTLTLGADGIYTYIGHGVVGGTIKSGDAISLAHGQSITVMGVPNGTAYTVTETDYAGDGYTTTSTGATGTIATNTTQTAAFTNTRTVGSLTISKTVAGNAADPAKKFDFTLTLHGADGVYAYTGNGVPDGSIRSGDTISLAHGQSITVRDLPKDATYTVTEADYAADGYKTDSTGATGSIVADETQTASFTNTRTKSGSGSLIPDKTGSLTISKTVTGAGADTEKKFSFKVTFSGASGSYRYTGIGVSDGTIQSGDTIALAHGQSITIVDLPAGATYEVSEVKDSAQGYSVESTGESGTISATQSRTAAFTNTKLKTATGSLTIGKTVTGQGASVTRRFKFTITFTGAPDAYAYTGSANGTLRSGDTVSLASGESITITGLPAGAQYAVTEADYSRAGYTVSGTGTAGTIAADALQTASFVNSYANSKTPGKPDDGIDIDEDGVPTGSMEDDGEDVDLDLDVGDNKTPTGSMEGEKNGLPKTGDNEAGSLAKRGLLFFSVLLAALTATEFTLRKKRSGQSGRK